jgi:dephospho-CoA kinase
MVAMAAILKIGLTGGIATGKSTVLAHWRKSGAATIDADELAHAALEPGTETYRDVVNAFGREVVNPDKTINRKRLGEIVFGDEARRVVLNQIIHPAVLASWDNWLRCVDARPAIVAVPLLYEVGLQNEFDFVVVVACSEQTQRARLIAKGLTDAQASARIASQWPIQRKIDLADFVIWNDGLPDGLTRQADMVWANIKESYHAPSKN